MRTVRHRTAARPAPRGRRAAIPALAVVAAAAAALSGCGATGVPAAGPGVDVRAGLAYAVRGDTILRMDALLPAGEGRAAPAAVLVHGGAWRRGHRGHMLMSAAGLARGGVAAFAIDYRRDGRHPFAPGVADIAAALAYVRRHAAQFGVDATRVALVGASSGGHLAALAATDRAAWRAAGGPPAGLVAWSAPMHLPALAAQAARAGECAGGPGRGCPVPRAILADVPALLGCPISARVPWPADGARAAPCPALYRDGSPVARVQPGHPPVLLVHARRDPLIAVGHALRMRGALRAAGVPHRVVVLPGAGHGARLGRASLEPTIRWMRRLPATPAAALAE